MQLPDHVNPPIPTRRFSMQKMMVSIAAVACLMCASAYSFANEMGKMANEIKGEMKADVDAMKGNAGAMKGEMKEEMKTKTDSMKASKDAMKDEMKATKDAMKGGMKGVLGY
jgi:hypothetical protein